MYINLSLPNSTAPTHAKKGNISHAILSPLSSNNHPFFFLFSPPLLHPSMAERVEPLDIRPDSPSLEPDPVFDDDEQPPDPNPPFNLKPPPGTHLPSGSYIVQFPRDQIYRVPPPENAHYVERFGNPDKQKGSIRPRLKWVIGVVLSLGVLITVILALFYTLVRPDPPTFHIDRFATKKAPTTRHSRPEYDFMLRVDNPNSQMGLSYGGGGSAWLEHKGVELADGEPPSFVQPGRNSTAFRIVLSGSDMDLPREIKKSFEGIKGSKGGVALTLTLTFPVRVKVWGVWARSMKMEVGCDMTVDSLGRRSRVTSQKCHSKI